MIDRYEILRKLATGGMAELFLAKQSGLEGFEKVVVIKRILSHLAQDEEFVSMFLDEARIAAKLSHPNIVQIYDLGKADDSYYIAMEYVSGRNVQHILTKQEEKGALIPIEHACRMMAGVCDGLHYAHSRKDYDGQPLNIVHRDISPQNILVSFAGGVKVVDFGIAKASTQLAQTRAGVLKGKYAYMSPEQVRGQKVDHRSDIFALGLVMYEMLTGRRPFERDSSLKTLKAIVQEKPLNPRELNPEIPGDVVKLLSRSLEKNPDRRYKNAQEMQLALEDYLESSPRKSNNVRLSRYLYELFDDELNSKQGTMVVQGIGEVIIPTGGKPSEKDQAVVEEEEIDSKTLSAALMPSPPEQEEAIDPPTQTASGKNAPGDAPLGRRKPSEPGVRVVRDDQRLPPPTDPEAEREGTDPNAQAPPGAFSPDESIEDEVEDKTIPVYDIEEYERERQRRERGEDSSDLRTSGGGDPPGNADSASLGTEHDSVQGEAIGGRNPAEDVGDKARAAAMLAKVDALAEGFVSEQSDALAETIPPPNLSDEDDPEWEDPTRQAPAGAKGGVLHSDEAVVGPNGLIPTKGEDAIRPPAAVNEVRPAAPKGGGVRPAAAPSARPPVARPTASSPSVSSPVAATPPAPPLENMAPAAQQRVASGPSPLAEPTPPTAMSPRAGGLRPTPMLMVALGVMGLLVLLTLGGLVTLLVLDKDSKKGVGEGSPRILYLDTEPTGVELRHNGVVYKTPATLIVEQGKTTRVDIVHAGKITPLDLKVGLGASPVKETIKLSAP